ncbi:ABC-three component system protein [Hymenobacter negativus]|uniref:ABC-three component systems C-terminal domain-containing protein n=1 Tax=Hymenobacter negativus TaxID=2795026 RepID=A0ABS3Q8L9_9BACT|nr:ABC-three component system protein [Hymenobacter negativus]MBO2007590.1 hypothetical protein [Hymenobacter negativus]
MAKKGQHSAAPQMLGYMYQAHFALYTLLQETDEEATVIIEGLDDIELKNTQGKKLQQLKSHIKKGAKLTDKSSDLWKTLRIWSTALKQKKWKPATTKLTLITTATAATGSIASLLRNDDKRDPDKALEKLLEVAANIKNEELGDALAAFNGLTTRQKNQLVRAIVLVDRAPAIDKLEQHIIDMLKLGRLTDKVQFISQSLLGWWEGKVVKQLLLNSEKSVEPHVAYAIKWIDVNNMLYEISSQYQRDNLPTQFRSEEPSEEFYDAQKGRMFVRQLQCLDVDPNQVRISIRKLYRAFNQRTIWAKEDLLVDGELLNYDRTLQEKWDEYRTKLKRKKRFFEKMHKESKCAEFGRDVLDWAEESNFPIRDTILAKDDYVTHGSYHLLADKKLPEVHWHPNFLNNLSESNEPSA